MLVAFANFTASSSVSNRYSAAIGANDSSCEICISCVIPDKMVGSKKYPFCAVRGLPPRMTCAPCLRASSTWAMALSMLRGVVRAPSGRPVEDARVTLLDAAGNVVDSVTTGADGVFRFVDLAAGSYTVIAAGYPPVATVLQLAGGGRTERDLELGHS